MKLASFGPLPPEWGGRAAGGVATYHAEMLRSLDEISREQLSVAIVPSHRGAQVSELRGDFQVLDLGLKDRETEKLKALASEYDALIVHHLSSPWTNAFVEAGEGHKVLCVVHSWTALLRDPSVHHVLQRNVDGIRKLIFPSRHSADQAHSLDIFIPSSSEVIYGPLSPVFHNMPVPQDNPRSGVLFVGSLIGLKRCGLLIEAMASLPETVKLTIAGDGPERASLEVLAKSRDLHHRVDFLGSQTQQQLVALYSQCEVLCVPSSTESLGLVYVEALSQGAAVVGYEQSMKEISAMLGVSCGFGYVSETTDPLANVLRRALECNWHRQKLSARTRDQFSRLACAGALQRVLEAFQ